MMVIVRANVDANKISAKTVICPLENDKLQTKDTTLKQWTPIIPNWLNIGNLEILQDIPTSNYSNESETIICKDFK